MSNDIARRIISSMRNRGVTGFFVSAFFDVVNAFSKFFSTYRDNSSGYYFLNNSGNKKRLVVVLAGYKPKLWPLTLARLSHNCPDDMDVCIVTAGKFDADLISLSKAKGWSYLSVRKNKTGLAINLAVKLHSFALLIHKLDEDVFISEDYFDRMEAGFNSVRDNGLYNPGVCTPTLNVNGVSYRWFLEFLGVLNEYEERFGRALVSCGGVPVHHDPSAALWIWTKSLPFDDISSRFRHASSKEECAYQLIGTRFSIGALLIERSFFEQIGGFRSSWRGGILGVDEEGLCSACVMHSRPMFYLKDVLVGHFSFFPQEKTMMESWKVLADLDPLTFSKLKV